MQCQDSVLSHARVLAPRHPHIAALSPLTSHQAALLAITRLAPLHPDRVLGGGLPGQLWADGAHLLLHLDDLHLPRVRHRVRRPQPRRRQRHARARRGRRAGT